MDIYLRPATQFVATFVGSPRINLLPVALAEGPDGMALAAVGGLRLQTRVPWPILPRDPEMMLGLRAEHVRVAAPGAGNAQAIARVVERLGERSLVHAELEGGLALVAEEIGLSGVRAGDAIQLAVDGGAAHLFDGEGRAYHADSG
jgi:multiple sugar transport system ATP-binding protein